MMWGSWASFRQSTPRNRLTRAIAYCRTRCLAILYSAPILNLGEGNRFEIVENLHTLVQILPYPDEKPFNAPEFLQKLVTSENSDRTIGAALFDQQILAGIGNYLKAEILFDCRLDLWRKIAI